MRSNPRRAQSIIAALLLAGGLSANAVDELRPTFASEVAVPEERTILPLLKVVCGEGVRTGIREGRKTFGCGDGSMDEILASRHRPRRYPWIPGVLWEADGVLFGHFLSPTSDDAAINCFACESHPNLWGGTLLLTRNAGKWEPVWYKAGVITRHCRRVSLVTGRQILFCEETDGGMGHSIHGLYTVDFKTPRFAWRNVVLMADSYSCLMLGGVQIQSIDRISFDEMEHGELLVRVYARHGRVRLRPDYAWDPLPTPKVLRCEIDFRLDGDSFRVMPETAPAARLFGVHTE
jgi:hypothetical protein